MEHALPRMLRTELFDEVRFPQRFEDAILQFGAVETLGRVSPDRDVDLSREIRKIGDGVPCREKHRYLPRCGHRHFGDHREARAG